MLQIGNETYTYVGSDEHREPETFIEVIERYRVMRRPIITDPQFRAEVAITGRDPDAMWELVYSSTCREDAEEVAKDDRVIFTVQRWEVVVLDNGERSSRVVSL